MSFHDEVIELAGRFDVASEDHSLDAYRDLTDQLHVVSSLVAQLGVDVSATLNAGGGTATTAS